MTTFAKKAADSVREGVEAVTSQAGAEVHRQAVGAMHQLGDTADTWTSNAGKALQEWGHQVEQAGRQQGGLAAVASELMGRGLQEGGTYLTEARVGGLTEALRTTVQRNPLTTVLIAIGVGWMLLARRSSH